MFTPKNLIAIKRTLAFMAGILVLVAMVGASKAEERVPGPRYEEQGQLIPVDGWRQSVFSGAPLTPNALNDGKASIAEFHNVHI